MAITLNWTNKNPGTSNIKIYRGNSYNSLTLLTTLASSVSSYVDATAVNNKLYYYQVNVVIGGADEIPGAILPMARYLDTGPGPQALAAGDMEWGYFGQLPVASFVSATDLNTVFNVGTVHTAPTIWYKLACQGKVIFVPNTTPRYLNGTSPLTGLNAAYAAGLLYGTGDNGKPHASLTAGATPVLQNKKIVNGSYEFYVRLPKGAATNATDVNSELSSGSYGYEPVYSEASLIASINGAFQPNPALMVSRKLPPKVFGYNASNAVAAQTFLTQHWSSNAMVITATTSNSPGLCLAGLTSGSSSSAILLPVLELIPG